MKDCNDCEFAIAIVDENDDSVISHMCCQNPMQYDKPLPGTKYVKP